MGDCGGTVGGLWGDCGGTVQAQGTAEGAPPLDDACVNLLFCALSYLIKLFKPPTPTPLEINIAIPVRAAGTPEQDVRLRLVLSPPLSHLLRRFGDGARVPDCRGNRAVTQVIWNYLPRGRGGARRKPARLDKRNFRRAPLSRA